MKLIIGRQIDDGFECELDEEAAEALLKLAELNLGTDASDEEVNKFIQEQVIEALKLAAKSAEADEKLES